MFRFILTILLLLNTSLYGQGKLDYFTFINKGDSCRYEKNFRAAINFYSKAISISAVNPYNIMSMVKTSLELKHYKKVTFYLNLAVKNGAFLGMLESDSNVFKFVKQDPLWMTKFAKLRQEHLASIPHLEDRTTLVTMLEKDQALRSLLGVIPFKKADSIIYAADTTNMLVIMQMVKRIGFPDIKKVGLDGVNAIYIMLLHTLNNKVRDKENLSILIPLMKDAVQQFSYPPFYMGIVIDRNRALNKQKQVYGTYWEPAENNKRIILPIENIKEVDKRRKEIGLPPLIIAKTQWNQTLPEGYL